MRKVGACGHAPIMFYLGEVPRRAGSKEGQVDGGGGKDMHIAKVRYTPDLQ